MLSSTAMPGGLRLVWEVMGSRAHPIRFARGGGSSILRPRSQCQAKVDTRFTFEPAQALPS